MRHPLRSSQLLPSSRRAGWPGGSQGSSRSHCKLQEQEEERAGSTRGARRRLPAVPAWAALTTSSLGASAGEGPATLQPKSCRSRAGATASRSAPSPPPGKPGPRPRPLLAVAAATPPASDGGAGATRISATRGSPARAVGSRLPPEKRQGGIPRVVPRRYRESDFGFATPRPLQSLRNRWKRERIGPALAHLRGRPGGYTALLFLLSTAFLEASSGEAHNHRLVSIRIPIV